MGYENKIIDKLTRLFSTNPKYNIEGNLNKNLLAEDARKYDADLLNLLQKDKTVKEHFFVKTEAGLVFKKDVFLQFITNKEFLPDSFTKYKIKIGLGSEDGSLLSEHGDVVLNWPYKDTILEGGQDKEDQKRKEVFFNEVLAPDQITRLLDDKVFTDWKRYDKDGVHELDELKDEDNLIIKGNNLVVLHSLKKRYAGKVKLIYIDPPYNTGNDGFNYNDSFNHSTWLTFMKNRLEVARDLLAEDGAIFVQCDDNEQAYLRIIMDEIFQRKNFVATVVYRRRGSQANLSKNISAIHDYILIYQKSGELQLNKIAANIDESEFKNPDSDPRGPYVTMPTTNKGGSKYTVTTPTGIEITNEWRFKRATYDKLASDNRLVFPRGGNGTPRYKLFLKDKKEQGVIPSTWWDDAGNNQEATREVASILGSGAFDYPKSETLMSKIIAMATNENDIVLDYHLGSGTTSAVAHKMKRQWIGIEQMEYIEDVAKVRLKKVVEGEQGGISKSVNWKGGGSFVYCNIMNNANKFRERVEKANSDKDYLELLKEAMSSSFLSYRVDPKKLNENDFIKLSNSEKRQLLLELIDNNTLYVNYDDINDPIFKVSSEDKKHNEALYKSTKGDV